MNAVQTLEEHKLQFVIPLFVKNGKILLGYKKSGIGAGKLMPPGGKVRRNEGIVTAIKREGSEETGLCCFGLVDIAYLRVCIQDIPETRHMHVYLVHGWTGNIQPNKEFSSMKFFEINKIPWEDTLHLDRYWLQPILDQPGRLYVRASIDCGSSRNEVRNVQITLSPLRQ